MFTTIWSYSIRQVLYVDSTENYAGVWILYAFVSVGGYMLVFDSSRFHG